MTEDVWCDYPEPAELCEEDVFELMAEAFNSGLIAVSDRVPILRLFTGATDLVFAMGGTEDGPQAQDARLAQAATLCLTPAVQRRLVDHFAHWLTAN